MGRKRDYWNRTESQGIDPNICGNITHDKDSISNDYGKKGLLKKIFYFL